MLTRSYLAPIDYLVIGHLTKDLTPTGPRIGGTASFSSLTAHALGLRVGVLTACSPELDRHELSGIEVVVIPSDVSTTFENVYTDSGRIQY